MFLYFYVKPFFYHKIMNIYIFYGILYKKIIWRFYMNNILNNYIENIKDKIINTTCEIINIPSVLNKILQIMHGLIIHLMQ